MKKHDIFLKTTAFTLAEMLIALAVIGIVAALTLPTLMTTISNKIKENQMEVFERKISKGTDLLNIENGIGPYYTSSTPSYEFAQALSKHLKIATICDKNNLKKCFSYDVIKQDNIPDFKLKDLKKGKYFGLASEDKEFDDVAGIVLGDGTPMIFSWNKNCPVSDPDKISVESNSVISANSTTSCIVGIFDLNGPKGPNRFGYDVIGYNGVQGIGGFVCTDIVLRNGKKVCVSNKVLVPNVDYSGINCGTGMDSNDEKYCDGEYGLSGYSIDYWAGANKACDLSGGLLPDAETLSLIFEKKSELGTLVDGFSGVGFWSTTPSSHNSATIITDVATSGKYNAYYKNTSKNRAALCIEK